MLAIVLTVVGVPAAADRLDDDLQTVWEVLWDQRGTPQWVYRWGAGPVNYRIHGIDVSRHRENITNALVAASQATGVVFVDVSTDSRSDQLAALDIEVTPNDAMPEHEPCATYFRRIANWLHERVDIRMRSGDAWRCAFHEVMHAMGVRGHPTGKTVLSYFPWRRDAFMDLDKVMLAAWYSPAMPRGASLFEALVVLTEAVAAQPGLGLTTEQAQARARAFRESTMRQLQDLGSGVGEVPSIVLRSGKASGAHMVAAQRLAAYFIGIAHLRGAGVARDAAAATPWFERAAWAGYTPAQVMFARALINGHGIAVDAVAAHRWLELAAQGGNTVARAELNRLEQTMNSGQLEAARSRPLPTAAAP